MGVFSGRNNTATTTKNEHTRYQGALKAQIHLAQGETLGKGIRSTIPAPCKGNYIDIEKWKDGKMELYCPDLRPDL
jgi:hypothetical protein